MHEITVIPLTAVSQAGRTALAALDCLSRRDYPALRRHLAENVVVEWPFGGPETVVYAGTDSFMKVLRLLDVFRTFALTATSILETAEIAVIEAESHGVRDGAPDYRNKYVFLFTVSDAGIVRWREYFNPITGGQAFGRKHRAP